MNTGLPSNRVLARAPGVEDLAADRFRERITRSLWFVPALFAVAAFVTSLLSIQLDDAVDVDRIPRWLPGTDASAAGALTSVVAAAMLTFLAVVFSTTLVAVQLAASQYSPRIVRVFVRSRLTEVTLGTFVATFVFALNAMVGIRGGQGGQAPVFTIALVYLFVFATVAMFLRFFHGMVRLLRVQYLLKAVSDEARPVLIAAFPPASTYREVEAPIPDPVPVVVRGASPHLGIVQALDTVALVCLAEERDCWIELLVEPGEYLGTGTPMAALHGLDGGTIEYADLDHSLLLGPERTLIEDPGFGLRQMVDVSSRGLSPAVNDPTTAVHVIDRLVDLLSELAHRPDPSGWYLDANDRVRLRVPEAGFDRLAVLAFTELIRYGADSPQVTRRLYSAFANLSEILSTERRAVFVQLRDQLDEALGHRMPPAFQEVARVPDRIGLG